jgi:hypothetical protein
MEFNVGDKVIALMDHDSGNRHGFKIIKGKNYIVKGVTTCTCGIKSLNVGVGEGYTYTVCSCGTYHKNSIWWVKAMRFTKADNDKSNSIDVTAFMDIFSKQIVETND